MIDQVPTKSHYPYNTWLHFIWPLLCDLSLRGYHGHIDVLQCYVLVRLVQLGSSIRLVSNTIPGHSFDV